MLGITLIYLDFKWAMSLLSVTLKSQKASLYQSKPKIKDPVLLKIILLVL